jgi:hypothetical protein
VAADVLDYTRAQAELQNLIEAWGRNGGECRRP